MQNLISELAEMTVNHLPAETDPASQGSNGSPEQVIIRQTFGKIIFHNQELLTQGQKMV